MNRKQDVIDFVAECFVQNRNDKIAIHDMYELYTAWAVRSERHKLPTGWFFRTLKELGFPSTCGYTCFLARRPEDGRTADAGVDAVAQQASPLPS